MVPTHQVDAAARFFTLQGIELNQRPATGVYMERTLGAEGFSISKKISTK